MHSDIQADRVGLAGVTQSTKLRRSGLSTLEFVGCAMAVIGGAWLGALYLGVDVRHVAHTALSEADLLDKVPAQWRPPGPKDDSMTREQLVATLREELGVLRQELSSLRGEQNSTAAGSSADGDGQTNTLHATKHKTLAYWSRLNDIALGEAALQRDAESAANGSNAARVFAIKSRISRFAAKSVEALPHDGVEEEVERFGRQLARWYTQGGELYERAVQIWESPAATNAREQLNQDWRRAEHQHRNEARLLHDKSMAVRRSVSRHFGHEFTEFAQPTAAGTDDDPTAASASASSTGKSAD